ncbi:MAG TPA: carboxypeptidase regulatory-like domain-containing protein, partial [Solirubrobacteraceae bacterium]
FSLGCHNEGAPSEPQSSANLVTLARGSLGTSLYLNANCGVIPGHICQANGGDPNGYAAALYLFAADLTLEQSSGPHASGTSGELVSAQTLRGATDIAFDATDPGAGVWQAVFSVDGQVVQRSPVNENGGRCRDVGQTTDGLPAFLYVQPCVQSVSADIAFDSTRASNGVHRLTVSVVDAAGNAAPVLNRLVTIDNPPPPGSPNGANASSQATLSVRWAGTAKASVLGGFAASRTLSGRLVNTGGAPIAGATIDVRATPSYAGAKPVAMASPSTDANGRFTLRLAPGTSSRTLRFAYRAHVGDPTPAATRTLKLATRAGIRLHVSPHTTSAGIRLHVSPHTTSAGHSISFTGRLRGGPIPAGGKQLVLEASSPGSGWIEFKVVRTDARGRYRASYRFKFAGPADYRFRVRSEAESDFPFAAGSSNVVRVHER